MSAIVPSNSSATTIQSARTGRKLKQWTLSRFGSNWEYILTTLCCTFTVHHFESFALINASPREPSMIHHMVCFLLVGLPLNYIQNLAGQYSQLGVIFFKHMCPIGHGVGYALILNSFAWCCAFGMLMADFLMYLLASIEMRLNWMNCPPNTQKSCWDSSSKCTKNCISNNIAPSAYVYWKEIYMNDPNLHPQRVSLGKPIFVRAVPLFITWAVIFAFVSMGMEKYKKIIRLNLYIISILVVILILVCFITDGSLTGVRLMFRINFSSLLNAHAWNEAIVRVIKILALARACHMTYGSYMAPTMPSDILTIFVVFLNFFATLLGSMITHATIGIIMTAAGVDEKQINSIWKSGNAPYFTVIPQGLGFLGVPQLWSVFFFLTCILIVFNNLTTQIDLIERSIADAHARIRVYRNYMLATICMLSSFVGLIYSSKEAYVVTEEIYRNVMPQASSLDVLVMSVMVFWIYRVQRISDDLHFMQGFQPTKFWKIFWYMMPCIIGFSYLYLTFLDATKVNENTFQIFHFLCCSALTSPIPIFMCYEILRYLKTHNLVGILQPEERWGPPDPEERHLRHLFNPRQEIRSRRRDDTCRHNCLLANKFKKNANLEEREIRSEFFKSLVKVEEEEDEDDDHDDPRASLRPSRNSIVRISPGLV